jgi:hypothetical protein
LYSNLDDLRELPPRKADKEVKDSMENPEAKALGARNTTRSRPR